MLVLFLHIFDTSRQLIVTLYALYLSLCTQTADPNHFRGTHCMRRYNVGFFI